MIVKSHEADRFVAKPPKDLHVALFFGPDAGLVHERADRLAKTVVDDLGDAFRVSELDDAALSSDPARLFDEAAAISMLGGRRVVRVRGAGNGHAPLFERFLKQRSGDALVVVEAGDLAKSSALRGVFEKSDAAAIQCYPDSAETLAAILRNALKAEGLSISSEALDDAVSRLGSDRSMARREIEKLVLYAYGRKSVSLDDVRAVMGDEADARSEEACDAAGEGDVKRLDLALSRLNAAGVSPIALVRVAMGHFQRVLSVKLATERGESVDAAMKKGWPQIHFARASSFKMQVSRWTPERLGEVLDLLLEAETLCKTTAVPAEAALGRTLFNIAALARARS